VQHGHLTLDCEAKTLAELLRDAGYQTVGLCANPHLSEARQFTRGFEEYFEMWRTKGIVHRLTDKLRWAKQRLKQRADCIFPAHRTLARLTDALQWHCDHGTRAGMINRQLRSWFRSQRDEERPCFVFINYTEAHLPYTMVPPFYRLSLGTPSDIRRAMDLNQDPRLHLATGAGMKDGDFDLLCRTSGRQGRERGDACRRS